MGCHDLDGFSGVARDHATNPRNHGPLKEFDGHSRITGPCGDTMEFWLIARNDKVVGVSFATDGCGSSLACGSIATILAQGKRIEDAAAVRKQDILNALGGLPPEFEHCALLAANTLDAACEDCLTRHNKNDQDFKDRQELQSRLCRVRHKLIVLSGKGGVGKSTVAVNIAVALMMSGKRVGLLDVDIHGPSIPTLLGLERESVQVGEDGLLPVERGGMKVMSLGFLLRNRDDAVIWRGPMKMGVIRQFLKDVVWGELDYLIVDSPPGTGDEPLSVCQLIGEADGAIIVTTPQEVALASVRKSITFCRKLNLPVLGVVENMSGFACPHCGTKVEVFGSGGGELMARQMEVPFLGRIPIDPAIGEACDTGRPYLGDRPQSTAAESFRQVIEPIMELDNPAQTINVKSIFPQKEHPMRIAIPISGGRLAMHFGHCERYAFMDVDRADKKIISQEQVIAPRHEPGLLPRWLADRGVKTVIVGGVGSRAQGLFAENGIEVVVGAPAESPDKLVAGYLAGTLETGANLCDH